MGAEILSIFFIDGAVWVVTLCGPQKVKKYVRKFFIKYFNILIWLLISYRLIVLSLILHTMYYNQYIAKH